MDEKPMQIGKNYDIKRATTVLSGNFEKINYKVDVNTYDRTLVDKLELNDIASCRMTLIRPIAADSYALNRQTGSFIVIDRMSNDTVGAGMIVGLSRRDNEDISRNYTEAEKELNAYIRKNFPEWDCKVI
jgi:sulfate adenylyltransferase subunit 1